MAARSPSTSRPLLATIPVLALLAMAAWPSLCSAQVQNPTNGHVYDVIGGAIPWSAAKSAAEGRTHSGVSGHLATIESAAEADWLINTFGASTLNNTWLGGFQNLNSPSYSEPAGGWEWVTGEPMSYTNWSSGEPNAGFDSDYMEVKGGGSPPGSWNDVQGGEPENRGYVVEYDIVVSPTPPATPIPCSATDDLAGGVGITWSDVADESGYRIRRDGVVITTRGSNVTSFTDIPPAGTYTYCVEAFNGAGTSSPCCDLGTKLLAPPATPSPCSASDNSPNSVVVTWTNVVDEASYSVYRDGGLIATLGPNVTTFNDLPSVGTHTYCVEAANAAGVSSGCCDSGTRLVPIPSTPGPCSASDNSVTGVLVSWTNVADEQGYRIYRTGGLLTTVGPNVTSYFDASPVGSFQYCVVAYNTTGQSAGCCDVGTRTNQAPAQGPGLGPLGLGLLVTLLGGAGALAGRRRA